MYSCCYLVFLCLPVARPTAALSAYGLFNTTSRPNFSDSKYFPVIEIVTVYYSQHPQQASETFRRTSVTRCGRV
ncbi:hypothetical protein GGR55DRAFT_653801 [Xylaria sp. FL0064]|nr:hypothetical protein GGR55DRAFT_653801 [Xylaria sp. FL0064]